MFLVVMDSTNRDLPSPVRTVTLMNDEMHSNDALDLLRQARMSLLAKEDQRSEHNYIVGTFEERLYAKELAADADLFSEMSNIPIELDGFTPITIPIA